MPFTGTEPPWRLYLHALTDLRTGYGIPLHGVRAVVGEALCDAWGIAPDLNDDAARAHVRTQIAEHVRLLTFRDVKGKDQRNNFIRDAPVIVRTALNIEGHWQNKELVRRREGLAEAGFSISTITRCEDAALKDIAMQIADMVAARRFSMPSRTEAALSDDDRRLQEHLGKIASVLEVENRSQADALLDRGTLPVPWTISSDESGTTARELALRFTSLAKPQMIILGAAGSGKTTLATMLIGELHERRRKSGQILDPIPVKLSLASWNPYKRSIKKWMQARLAEEYPELISALSEVAKLGLSDLLIERWILPVLDGFDEIPGGVMELAFRALTMHFRERPVILTSRIEDFTKIRRATGFFAGGIEVQMSSVAPDAALKYLGEAVPAIEPEAWQEIFAYPSQETAEALASPLMLWLTADICSAGQSDPRDLLISSEGESVRSRLLRSLVPAAFERLQAAGSDSDSRTRSYATPKEATTDLAWLASHLKRLDNTSSISWWQIESLSPFLGVLLGISVLAGAAAGLLAGRSLFSIVLPVALVLGAFFGFGCGRGYSTARKKGVADRGRIGYSGTKAGADPEFRPHLHRLGMALLATAAFTVALRITARFSPHTFLDTAAPPIKPALEAGIAMRTGIAAIACCCTALPIGFGIGWYLRSTKKKDEQWGGAQARTPREALCRDRQNSLKISIIGIVICGCAVAAIFYILPIPQRLLAAATVVTSSLTGCLVQTAWPRYRIAHLWLALRDRIPPSFMSFLEEAHRVGILRQAGLSYVFRHELLRKCLIDMHDNPRATTPSQPQQAEAQLPILS